MNKSIEHITIKEAIKGDIKSFKKIFEYYMPKMREVATRYAYTTLEVDDILQESFIKIFNNLKNFKFDGSFEGWIRRIVINTATTFYHKQSKRIDYNSLEGLNLEEISECSTISQHEKYDWNILENAINSLPNGYKVIFNMYAIDELAHKEIAEILGISESTSRSQYSKARVYLKKILSTKQHN